MVTNAVLVLDPKGRVLASSGLPEALGRADLNAASETMLTDVVRGEGGDDIAGELQHVVASPPGTLATMVVESAREQPGGPRRQLTLHRISDSFVIGVLAGGDRLPRTETELSESVLLRVWSGLRGAMALTTPGHPDEPPSIIAVNAAFGELFRVRPEEARGRPLMDFLAPGDGLAVVDKIHQHATLAGESVSDVAIVRRGRSDPTVIEWEVAPIRDRAGTTQALFVLLRDVAEAARWRPGRGLELDPLSGLPNRLQLMSRLERSVERTARSGSCTFAVLGVEIDGLASAERRLGATVGNALLDALVWRVRQGLRPGDVIARVGPERLAVLLDHFAPRGHLEAVLERIDRVAEDTYSIGGEHIQLRVIGAAGPVWTPEHPPATADEVLASLDLAVTRARAQARRSP